MMELKWTQNLSVGNAVIDIEHRNLIGMVNNVIRHIRTRDSQALRHAMELLEGWLHAHFRNEEMIAQAIGFPIEQNKPAQQYSLRELQYLKNELSCKEGCWSDSSVKHFTDFLKKWMIDEHILRLDMQMKPALQAHEYDFFPGWKHDETPSHADRTMACGCGCGCDQHPMPNTDDSAR